MLSKKPFGIIAGNIQVPVLQNQPSNFYVPSSVPASQSWHGEYGFTVSFTQEQKSSKALTWTYSEISNKLYVKKDASCPINFSANTRLPDDVFVRATAFYSSPDHVSEVVHRCINHSTDDLNKGLAEAEHLIRCECRNAQYQIDPLTYRHSVVVPFENPCVGQEFSTFIYKFTCFGSCSGGPNRRPMMIVFTLEKDNKVIGHHRIDVKICACPGRDKKYEECLQTVVPDDPVKGRDSVLVNLSDSMEFVKNVAFPVPKKVKVPPTDEGPYTIKTDNLNCFEFLKQMRTFYEICYTMKGLPPDISSALVHFQQLQHIKKENS
ncbi:cellular tumor antigen p53-like [Uloborus diversus]|uniref:cellular tumor antigen p53-like n=1 Tax=Uloborus diversus TaxID=327109 RepID=UPI00240A3E51|nr:cellular tumor antigen p53-like [Uloborus diversus]